MSAVDTWLKAIRWCMLQWPCLIRRVTQATMNSMKTTALPMVPIGIQSKEVGACTAV